MKLAGIAGAMSLIPFASGSAGELNRKERGPADPRWQHRLSRALVDDSSEALAKVVRSGGTATHADWAVAAFATKSLSNHLRETGFTADVERDILQNGSTLRIDDAAWDNLQQALEKKLGRGSSPAGAGPHRISAERREAAEKFIGENGIDRLIAESVTALEAAATRVQQRALGGRPIESLRDDCQYLTMIIDAINLIAGLNAAGCAFGCAPCCLIALAFGLVGLAMQLFVDTYIC
jgi:hypothetical protein